MLKKVEIYLLKSFVKEYGVKDTVAGLALALQEYADDMSDLGFKEKAVQAVSMADVLADLVGE
jgi:hypothetical protein